jgi:hypothetical protein
MTQTTDYQCTETPARLRLLANEGGGLTALTVRTYTTDVVVITRTDLEQALRLVGLELQPAEEW